MTQLGKHRSNELHPNDLVQSLFVLTYTQSVMVMKQDLGTVQLFLLVRTLNMQPCTGIWTHRADGSMLYGIL